MYLTRSGSRSGKGRRRRAGYPWRILAIGDVHSPGDFVLPLQPRDELDLIVTLGDVPPSVIEQILWWGRGIPVVGIPGNHDKEDIPGIVNVHGRVVEVADLRIAGFGGARQYRAGPNQFRDWQVARKLYLLGPSDVFLSHAPPLCTSAEEGWVHRGFAAFDRYIERRQPSLWLHGHLAHGYTRIVGSTAIHGVVGKRLLTLSL